MPFLKEPLVQFLLVGFCLFALDALTGTTSEAEADDRQIRIRESEFVLLEEIFAKQWSRPPTEVESKALREKYVEQEVFYREALALGLDKDDSIIRRRLVQKMEFLFVDVAAVLEPTTEQLQQYYSRNQDKYLDSAVFSFVQVYLNPDRHGERLEAEADRVKNALAGMSPEDSLASEMGDPLMLPAENLNTSLGRVERTFGNEFASRLAVTATGQWVGPIGSGFGIHFIYVTDRIKGQVPPFEQVVAQVKNDYAYEQRQQIRTNAYKNHQGKIRRHTRALMKHRLDRYLQKNALRLALLACLLSAAWSTTITADESRPGSLRLIEIEAGVFDLIWQRPARGNKVISMDPVLPEHCESLGNQTREVRNDILLEKWRVNCGDLGLEGFPLEIEGIEKTVSDVLIRIVFLNGSSHSQLVSARNPSLVVAQTPTALEVARDYLVLGVEHILAGIDHLLFVLCLVMLVSGFGNLVKTITAFTIAHSITLVGSVLELVTVPQGPVEAVIALSILFLARELLLLQQPGGELVQKSLTLRSPWLIAFSFGLLHGFGFAGALNEIGLPPNEIPVALLMFNVGVEIGQLIFVTAIICGVYLIRLLPDRMLRRGSTATIYSIGGISAYWFVDRVSGLWI